MHAFIGVKKKPHLGLWVLFKFLHHQRVTTNTGGPGNPFDRITSHILTHTGSMRRNILRLAANRPPAGRKPSRQRKFATGNRDHDTTKEECGGRYSDVPKI